MIDNNYFWLYEDFCRIVNELQKTGLSEDEAKTKAKELMNASVDVVTGKKSLADVLLNL